MPIGKKNIGLKLRTVWISLLTAILLVTVVITSAFAYVIIDGSKEPTKQSVVEFVPGKVEVKVTCSPPENGEYTFTVQNIGDVSAYVRLAVMCYWRAADGTIFCEKPDMVFMDSLHGDYDLEHNKVGEDAPQWIHGVDDYHYFLIPVAAGAVVPNVSVVRDPTQYAKDGTSTPPFADVAPEGYSFSVTVIAEGIQAVGNNGEKPAIQDAWGTTVVTNIGNDGKLTITRKSS